MRYKDLVGKGHIINKERDSLILKSKREADSIESISKMILSNSYLDDQ